MRRKPFSSGKITIITLVILVAAGLGAAIFAFTKGQFLGRPPALAVKAIGQTPTPSLVIGKTGMLEVAASNPASGICELKVTAVQDGKSVEMFHRGTTLTRLLPAFSDTKREEQLIAAAALLEKGIKDGAASLEIVAVDCSRFRKHALLSQPFSVDLTPPALSVNSTYHVINQGGAELAVYRTSEDTVWSGVRVGPYAFKGYKVPGTPDASGERFAFFVFSYELPVTTPIEIVARDAAGNESKTALSPEEVKAQNFALRELNILPDFIANKVSAIIARTPGLSDQSDPGDPVKNFLLVNSALRKQNADFLRELAQKSEERFFWKDAFRPLGNAAVEARFADYRSYLYNGQKIDEQVHLGYDLASVKNTPVYAGGAGKVIYADYLGIYGNAVAIDHGYGLMSLYGHLNSMDVRVGDKVEKDQKLGNSGETGLAGGDHLHYSMLIQGVQTDSKEFWDPHWIEDHVYSRLLREMFGQ